MTTGNEVDVSVPELLLRLGQADDINVPLGYLEGVNDHDTLAAAADLAAQWDKPLVLLKSGRSPEGARAVRRHTGSDAGDDAEFEAILAHKAP